MARDYYKVLRVLAPESKITIIGRGLESARSFKESTGCLDVVTGGLVNYLATERPQQPDLAIVSVGVPELAAVAESVLKYGCGTILLEKPGGVNEAEIQRLADLAQERQIKVLLAYNRRFYESVRTARQMIKEDGGPSSFTFEFTEWSHIIATLRKPQIIFDNWLLANSSHVIDMAFYLAGQPARMSCFVAGQGRLGWHTKGSVFNGAGVTSAHVPFSYQADWTAPGRWAVEVMTTKHRYIFRPLEKLLIQKIGSIETTAISLDDHLDNDFKPGLYRQLQSCLEADYNDFATLEDQINMARYCTQISGGC